LVKKSGRIEMARLNFGSFLRTVKEYSLISKQEFLVPIMLNIINRKSDPQLDKGDSSRYINNLKNIPNDLCRSLRTPNGRSVVTTFFENEFMQTVIDGSKIENIIDKLVLIIEQDETLDQNDKKDLLNKRSFSAYTTFISEIYLVAMTQSNLDLEWKNGKSKTKVTSTITIKEGYLFNRGIRIDVPLTIIPVFDLEESNLPYTNQLFHAYAEATGFKKVTFDTIPLEYQEHFKLNRRSYHDALTKERKLRDIYVSKKNQFEEMKDDIFVGIYYTITNSYPNTLERIRATLEHVTLITLKKSILPDLKGWIGNSERQGICHMLVNEGKLSWIK
jgi:hypothetical protein